MIKCPKCGSNHVSIVSVITSKKQNYYILDIIQGIAMCGWIFSALFFTMCITGTEDAIDDIFSYTFGFSTIITESGKIATAIVFGIISAKCFKWSFIIWIITRILKHLLPHQTSSFEKCICHGCELQWIYTVQKQQNHPNR